ncbi:MAG: hypothetical protein J0L92_34280 [Deltaproteobacteria bacterium]|nr:hypothetical protein [Deltaproteobacteria bacterium]
MISPRLGSLLAPLCVALGTISCAEDPGPQRLSEWGIFADGATQTAVEGLVEYELRAPLFSDYSSKHRFIRLPPGETITVEDATGRLLFPEGTLIVKTFGFHEDLRDPSSPERIVETRLLERRDGRWLPYVYLWDETASDATSTRIGARVPVTFTDLDGEERTFSYRVPSVTQCGNCHGGRDDIEILGPRVEQLDRDHDYGSGPENQLEHLVSMGWLAAMPTGSRTFVDPADETAPIDARARSYLHANCAHCHRDGGAADQSGLWLDIDETGESRLGFCKIPAAAGRGTGGRSVDIWPGDPDRSILMFRVESDEPGIKMPELPAVLVHDEGVEVLRAWIASLPPRECAAP